VAGFDGGDVAGADLGLGAVIVDDRARVARAIVAAVRAYPETQLTNASSTTN